MKKILKTVTALMLAMFCLTSCSLLDSYKKITVPDVSGVDEATAKNVLSSNGLIPYVEYVYDDTVAEGNVIGTDPIAGSQVEKNTRVKLNISKGAAYLESKASRITWTNISAGQQDNWEFYTPYIQEETLYIQCHDVKFATGITWKDNYQKGILFGEACITDTFDKTVPVSATYEKQSWAPNEPQSFTLAIPLSDLNENRPTTMHIKLTALDAYYNNVQISISFTMTW